MRFATPKTTAFGVFLILFGLYLLTLSPTFGFVDKGEMAAVASTLGIAHPTGYPSTMLLGKLFVLLLPGRDVVALNIMSALLTAAGGGVLSLLFDYLLRMAFAGGRGEEKKEKEKGKKEKEKKRGDVAEETSARERTLDMSPPMRSVMAGIAALLTGLTATWWGQGTSFEVYSLHCLMMPLLTLLFLRYLEQEAARDGEPTPWDEGAAVSSKKLGFTRRGGIFALVLGLAFTNHLTTILLAPPFLVWYFWRLGINERALQRLLYLVPFFLPGLLPYLWLPLRASADPFFNWGNTETLWAFMRHVTGAQYRNWMFTNPDTFPQQSYYFFSNLTAETVYIGLALALLGILSLARRPLLAGTFFAGIGAAVLYVFFASGGDMANPVPATNEHPLGGLIAGYVLLVAVIVFGVIRLSGPAASMRNRIGLFAALAFLTCLFYAGGYDIMEIGPYYLTAFFAVGIWMLFGLVRLAERFGGSAAIAAAGVLALLFGVVNYGIADESDMTLVEDMTVNVLAPLPENALIFSKQWDFWVAGSFYMQEVEKLRPDVMVIDHELLRRSWYLDQLQANYPEFMAKVKGESQKLRDQLYKFERDIPYNPMEIEAAYVGLINAMVDRGMESRPVLATPDFDEQRTPQNLPLYGGKWGRVPYYLAYRFVSDTTYVPQDFPSYRFRFAEGKPNAYMPNLYWFYSRSCLERAAYEQSYGKDDLARRYREYAKTFDPNLTEDDIPALPLNSALAAREQLARFQWLRGMNPDSGR